MPGLIPAIQFLPRHSPLLPPIFGPVCQSTDDNTEAPTDEGAASDMPPDEDTEQQPNDADGQ
jgi:hypothetical protein